MLKYRIDSAEGAWEGHPDKVADQISDALLDRCLDQDRDARVALETLVTRDMVVVAGEVRMSGNLDFEHVVRRTLAEIGYTSTQFGLEAERCAILLAVHEQAKNIARSVDRGFAGDQGIVYGMAVDETPEMMPLAVSIAHGLARESAELRRKEPELGLRPDGKSQVSICHSEGGTPHIQNLVIAQQHDSRVTSSKVREIVEQRVVEPVLQRFPTVSRKGTQLYINSAVRFTAGGPETDTGLTGRKLMVDTYGSMYPHGGGAFSGKDPSKIDRSGAYMARHIAKCIVAANLATKVRVWLSYAFGISQPLTLSIDTMGTGKIANEVIAQRVRKTFDLTPRGIVDYLSLKDMRYQQTARNGHFGNPAYPWESTAMATHLAE